MRWKPRLMRKPGIERWCGQNTPRNTREQKGSQMKSKLKRQPFAGYGRDIGVINYAKLSLVTIRLLNWARPKKCRTTRTSRFSWWVHRARAPVFLHGVWGSIRICFQCPNQIGWETSLSMSLLRTKRVQRGGI